MAKSTLMRAVRTNLQATHMGMVKGTAWGVDCEGNGARQLPLFPERAVILGCGRERATKNFSKVAHSAAVLPYTRKAGLGAWPCFVVSR